MGVLSARSALIVLSALLLVTAGCVTPESSAADGGVEPPSGDRAATGFSDIRTLNATIEWHYDRPDENETLRQHYIVRPYRNKVWAKTLAPPGRAGNLEVSNGSVIWEYNASRNRVLVQKYEGVNRTNLVDRKLEYIFNRLNESSETDADAPSVGVSPLPVVPAGGGGGNLSLANVSLEYGGIEPVAGRRAHVVRIQANETRTGLRNQTVWFDTETFYQLRAETVFVDDGNVTRITQRVTDVAFNEDVSDERFQFEPPGNASVERAGSIELQTYSTREALAANVSMSLPDPDLTGTFTFTEGRHIVRRSGGNTVTLASQIYTRQVNSLVVIKSTDTTEFANLTTNDSVQALTVGDREGYFLDRPRSIVWTCGDHLYQIAGQFQRERLVRIGESMVCD
jgi:outer membrane lipoprotein-sorting protein